MWAAGLLGKLHDHTYRHTDGALAKLRTSGHLSIARLLDQHESWRTHMASFPLGTFHPKPALPRLYVPSTLPRMFSYTNTYNATNPHCPLCRSYLSAQEFFNNTLHLLFHCTHPKIVSARAAMQRAFGYRLMELGSPNWWQCPPRPVFPPPTPLPQATSPEVRAYLHQTPPPHATNPHASSLHRPAMAPLAVATPYVHSCLRYTLPEHTCDDLNAAFHPLDPPTRTECETILHPLLSVWLHEEWGIDTEILARPPFLAPAFQHHLLQTRDFLNAHRSGWGQRAVCLTRATDPVLLPLILPHFTHPTCTRSLTLFLIGEVPAALHAHLTMYPPTSTTILAKHSFPIPQPEMLAGTYTHQGRGSSSTCRHRITVLTYGPSCPDIAPLRAFCSALLNPPLIRPPLPVPLDTPTLIDKTASELGSLFSWATPHPTSVSPASHRQTLP